MVPQSTQSLHHDPKVDFELECALLGQCECCITICDEDALLVSKYCRSTLTLPYYPTRDRYYELLRLRRERETSEKKHVLILGTVQNPPTRLGVEDLLKGFAQYRNNKSPTTEIKVILAGHGTEAFKTIAPNEIQVEGSVSNERLRELQLHARATLIHHPKTTGSLTRVVEALIGGIPVICNKNAARGHNGNHGLHVVDSVHDLWNTALTQERFDMPAIPDRPKRAEDRVRQELAKYLKKAS
jgi:glycosyltransferase involved in cell wall biosynthesis